MVISKEDIIPYIHTEKTNSFKSHFFTILNNSTQPYTGEIEHDKIIVWRTSSWIKSIYPVFTLYFNERDELIDIQTSMNSFGKILRFILYVPYLIIFSFFFIKIPFKDLEARDLFIPILFVCILLLLSIITKKVYTFETKNLREELFDIIGIEKEIHVAEKEYTLSKVIIRILLYPFCIGLLMLSIFIFFPNGEIFYAFGAIGISLTYIITDLKILLSNKKP